MQYLTHIWYVGSLNKIMVTRIDFVKLTVIQNKHFGWLEKEVKIH